MVRRGRKNQKGTRTSISLPGDLKRQMSKVGETVNWSAVACRSFKAKLEDMSTVTIHVDEKKLWGRFKVDCNTAGCEWQRALTNGLTRNMRLCKEHTAIAQEIKDKAWIEEERQKELNRKPTLEEVKECFGEQALLTAAVALLPNDDSQLLVNLKASADCAFTLAAKIMRPQAFGITDPK